jgi:hypothetical protein
MSSGETVPTPTSPGTPLHRAVTRRGFLRACGLAGSGLLIGPSISAKSSASDPETSSSLSAAQSRMALQIARVGSIFPIEFPSFGETGSATSRATASRLHGALGRVTPARLARARSGLDALIAAELLDVDQERLLAGIGRIHAQGTAPGLTAAVAVAVATVSDHFDPNADAAAQVWLGGLRWLHENGARPVITVQPSAAQPSAA